MGKHLTDPHPGGGEVGILEAHAAREVAVCDLILQQPTHHVRKRLHHLHAREMGKQFV